MAELTIAAVGLAFSVAQTILAALQCSELKALFGSDHLESLERSVTTLQAVLLDADSKQAKGIELSAQERDFIVKINDVLYDADDLLDAYVARAKLKQIRMEGRNKPSYAKVRGLASRFKSLIIGSPEAKKIGEKLDKIGRDAQNYKFASEPIRIRREETCSHVNENEIIGRGEDQRRIVDMLIHPIVQGELPVLAIVGIGGLGKTALAQLVYNDLRIQNEFSLRLWVCVSDQGGKQFDLRAILAGIYMSATREKSIGDMGLDMLVQELKGKLDQNKYLLVLDDLWSEKRDQCRYLVDILMIGSVQRGSRIVVTTRSIKTAKAIGSSRPYELQGLSDGNSWLLFEKKVGREIKEGHDLFEIGKDIVKKCVNVPLAIKVVGSLLRDAPKNEWQSFQKSRLLENKKDDNGIMWILKFSYYHLSPSLKSCFTYCALFPKDFGIEKEDLISMWMAHGYVKDEDEAEYHFEILGQRSFFQDIKELCRGKIEFKIHDLMHDMAQEIAGKEIYIANSATTQLDKNIRHLYDDAPEIRTKGFVTLDKIRSYVHDGHVYNEITPNIQFVSTVLAKWRHLRVLNLGRFGIRELPDAIGELLHLRHLDLHGNEGLGMLPEAITKLIHLQFLNLDGCSKLKELPRNFKKLVNLQFLNLDGCSKLKELPRDFKKLVKLRTLYVTASLEYMPLGMGTMTSLTKLNRFIVGGRKSRVKQEDMLESLRGLRNLKGSLEIEIKEGYKHAKEYCGGGGGYICNTQHLNSISIAWVHERNEEGRVGNDEDLLEDLQPHRNLKELEIRNYDGVRIPSWAREDSLTTSLPNLVKIKLWSCDGLDELPWLGRLQHLKILRLWGLENVEYMENRRSIGSSSDVASNSSTVVESSSMLFFPSLEQLDLNEMPKLKGWWRGSSDCTSFPCLSYLHIEDCPNLASIPLCPAVKSLKLSGKVNKKIGVLMREEDEKKRKMSSSGNIVENSSNQYLKALPMVAFQRLARMEIYSKDMVESLSEYEEVLRGCSSSLKSLTLVNCWKLRSVCQGGLEYLTALQDLRLWNLSELEFDEREEMPWRSLAQSLRSLHLDSLEKVDSLPKGMRYLTSLRSLKIRGLQLLKEIPEWIECLSSLQYLEIRNCKSLATLPRALLKLTSLKDFLLIECNEELHRRCEKPDGEYWAPILHHIPKLNIRNYRRYPAQPISKKFHPILKMSDGGEYCSIQ